MTVCDEFGFDDTLYSL